MAARIMLLKSKGNEQLYNMRLIEGEGKDVSFKNVVGPNGHPMLGWRNDKGHITIFESDPNRARKSSNDNVSIAGLIDAMGGKGAKALV